MPELPKVKRRPLKVYPDGDAQLAELVRALERIADGVESIVETLDAVIQWDEKAAPRLRTVSW